MPQPMSMTRAKSGSGSAAAMPVRSASTIASGTLTAKVSNHSVEYIGLITAHLLTLAFGRRLDASLPQLFLAPVGRVFEIASASDAHWAFAFEREKRPALRSRSMRSHVSVKDSW